MIAEFGLGLTMLAGSIVWGVASKDYAAFITMVAGYWMVFDSLNRHLHGPTVIDRLGYRKMALLVVLGGLFGLVLDFGMILSGIIVYHHMDNAWILFLLYLGWGVSLPAMVESTRLFYWMFGRIVGHRQQLRLPFSVQKLLERHAGWAGALMMLLVMFFFVHLHVPGFFIIPWFFGQWLVMEKLQSTSGQQGTLATILAGSAGPVFAIAGAAVLFCLAWEGMGATMGFWNYANLFWLQPLAIGIPIVAFFGYFCWFALYLSFFEGFASGSGGRRTIWESFK